jgi:hypothetical protein
LRTGRQVGTEFLCCAAFLPVAISEKAFVVIASAEKVFVPTYVTKRFLCQTAHGAALLVKEWSSFCPARLQLLQLGIL